MYRSVLDYFHTPDVPLVEPQPRLHIYCDGACVANGRRGAKAAYGVSVQKKGQEIQTLQARLSPTEPHTNQRAELRGMWESMKLAMNSVEGADIYTDSEYAMKCLQEWAPGWAARGWKKADGEVVQHQDILKPMYDIWRQRGTKIRLFHVRSHTGYQDLHSRGNERADTLARTALFPSESVE
jgi:ribonuclease HI